MGALAAALAWTLLAGSAAAQGADLAAFVSAKAASGGKRAVASHAWHDGGARRPLVLESGWGADFSGALSGKSVAIRPASGGALKDVSASLQSPVFRDEGGRLRARWCKVAQLPLTRSDGCVAKQIIYVTTGRLLV